MASTNTPNLGLYKATPGTDEPFRTTDVNANMDKLDAAISAPYIDFVPSVLNTSITETQLIGVLVGPPQQGSFWKISAAGFYGHTATPTTLNLRVRLDHSLVAAMTITTPASALSGKGWRIDGELTNLTLGVSGLWKFAGLGFATVNTTDTPTLMSPAPFIKDTAGVNLFEITAQWGASNVANSVTIDAGQIYRVTNS